MKIIRCSILCLTVFLVTAPMCCWRKIIPTIEGFTLGASVSNVLEADGPEDGRRNCHAR